jgi:hypothetical protein
MDSAGFCREIAADGRQEELLLYSRRQGFNLGTDLLLMDANYETGYITETYFQTMIFNRVGLAEFHVTVSTRIVIKPRMLDIGAETVDLPLALEAGRFSRNHTD